MKKAVILAVVMAMVLCAVPAMADGCGSCKPAKPCVKSHTEYFFQSTSDSIAGFRPKPWPVRPMKQAVPMEKGQPWTFQGIANSISGKAPAETKAEVPTEKK
jgi:hypothetical protein